MSDGLIIDKRMGLRAWCLALCSVLVLLQYSNASSVDAFFSSSMVPVARGYMPHTSQAIAFRHLAEEHDGDGQQALQRCLQASLKSFIPKCAKARSGSLSAMNSTIKLPESALLSISRDSLVWLLRTCLTGKEGGAAEHTTKVLLAGGVYARILENITSVYTDLTNVPIKIQQEGRDTYGPMLIASLFNPTNTTLTHSVWMMTLSGIGDAVAIGSLKDLTNLVLADRRIDWQDVVPVLRTAGLLFNNRVVSLPWVTTGVYLYYRKDVFESMGFQPAKTWQELIDLAARVNGTGDMWGLCVGTGPCQRVGTILLRTIYASLVQTKGSDQGWAFDPDSMELLLDSAAMKEAMRIYKALLAVSGPDLVTLPTGCNLSRSLFVQGKCMMFISDNVIVKMASHSIYKAQVGKIHGALGVSLLPGSPVVLDVPTDTLVPCDAVRCPYADRVLNSSGLPWLVNSAPGTEVVVLALNQHFNEDDAYYAFTVASFISSAAVSDLLLYDPYSEMYPSRFSQLNLQKWIQNGYNGANIQEFLAVHQAALSHPNNNMQLRCAGATLFIQALGAIVGQLNNQTLSIPVELLASDLKARARAVFSRQHGGNATRQKEEYWESINRKAAVAQPRIAGPVPELAAAAEEENQLPNGMIALAVCLVVAGAVLIGIAGFVLRRKLLSLTRDNQGGHPGVGPLCTLLTTDIQDSTSLWESLDASVMDAAAKLHNACIRNLAAKYAGYESVWEGDSFILAFRTPQAALHFALSAQRELLAVPWPSEVLASSYANEVWVKYTDNSKFTMTDIDKDPAKIREKLDTQKPSTALLHQDSAGSANSEGEELRAKEADPVVQLPYRDSSAGIASTASASLDGDPLVKRLAAGSDTASQSTLGTNTAMINAHFKEAKPGVAGYTLFDLLQASVTVVSPGTAGAACVYRGLRVRMGMHSGLTSEAEVNYNSRMARYHYTGPLRTTSAAVTSAAQGGMILMSSKVAALLDPDASGTLRDLPSDCQVYHMGDHRLSDLPDDTLELLQVQPLALRSRLVLGPSLRSEACTNPGSMAAPLPRTAKLALGCTSLVYVRVVGLDTLVAWNKQLTVGALKSVQLCANLETAAHQGVVSEDGLSLYIRRSQQPAASALSSTLGQFASAFPDAASALQFAIALRRNLLLLDWDSDILQHELGHQLGSSIVADLESECAEAMMDLAGAAGIPVGGTIKSVDGAAARVSRAGGVQPPISSLGYGVGPGSAVSDATIEVPQLSAVSMSSSIYTNQKPPGSMMSSRLGFLVASIEPGEEPDNFASTPKTIKAKRGLGLASKSQGTAQQQKSAGYAPCILDTPMLRGLRIRQCVISGDMSISVDTHGSGRAVYRGKPIKQLQSLMSTTKAGQILVSSQAMAALFPPGRR